MNIDKNRLYDFIKKAGRSTYAASGVESVNYDKNGFKELSFAEGDYSYKDTYTGFFRSRGIEIVTYKNNPVWVASYGGGMLKGDADFALQTFEFLKKAFLTDEVGFQTFRGPHQFEQEKWRYKYDQDGDIEEFSGYEEIYFDNKLVFFHRIIGGLVKQK
jgi:hypothetical protein